MLLGVISATHGLLRAEAIAACAGARMRNHRPLAALSFAFALLALSGCATPAGGRRPRKLRTGAVNESCVISRKGAWFSYARETYAIGDITMADGSERHLRSGPNAKVPVFNAVPGKVTLVGGVKVLAVGEGVSLLPDPSVTRARAARFVAGKNRREHHRENRTSARVANGKMSWVAMPDSCARR